MNIKPIGIAAALLTMFSLIGVGLVALTNAGTEDKVAANQQARLLRSVTDLVPRDRRDNDIFENTLTFVSPELLGQQEAVTVYRAFLNEQPIAAVFAVVAPDGYSGKIRLMIGINADGTLAGARVLEHKETPGLGDGIEKQRSDWILGFSGRSLSNPAPEKWTVKKDGGEFDQFTGATITPRAVVGAVRKALVFYEENRQAIFPPSRDILPGMSSPTERHSS